MQNRGAIIAGSTVGASIVCDLVAVYRDWPGSTRPRLQLQPVIAPHSSVADFATLLLSVLLLILNTYVKDLDPGQAAQRHRDAASDI